MLRRKGGITRGFIGRSWMIRSVIRACVGGFWGSERRWFGMHGSPTALRREEAGDRSFEMWVLVW